MNLSLNNKENKRFKYYYSDNIKNRKNFFITNYIVLFMLFASIIFSLAFILKVNIKQNNYLEKDYKIKNMLTVLNDIYRYKNLSQDDLKQLADLINNNSNKYNIEPELILAIITVESSFNKNAVSKVGAKGLMQIMPATFIEAANELGLNYKSVECIYDIENNINIGTYYLSKMLNKYNNDIKLAVLAYNWGPYNIDKFIRNKQSVPSFYYNKVMDHYKKYVL